MALTWSFESLETPIFSVTLFTLRALVPVVYISTAAATRAFILLTAIRAPLQARIARG